MNRSIVLALSSCLVGCGPVVIGFAEDAASTSGSTTASSETETETETPAETPLPDYVAVGARQHIAVSYDQGRTWEEFPGTGSEDQLLEGLARGPDRVVAVGGDYSFVTEDGQTWNPTTSQMGYARAIAWGSDAFVSVGLGRRSRSYDGNGWIDERTGEEDGIDFTGIAYGDGRFVAVGKGAMATSNDGREWITTPVADPPVTSVTYFEGRFVAVGYEGRVRITDDGVNVSHDDYVGGEFSANFTSVCVFGDQLVAGVESSAIRVSDDGIEWAENALPADGALACGREEMVALSAGQIFRGDSVTSFEPVFEASADLLAVAYTGD